MINVCNSSSVVSTVANKNIQRRSKLYAIFVFVVALLISLLIICQLNIHWLGLRKSETKHLLETQSKSIEVSINRSLGSASVIAAWVESNHGEVEGFNDFADAIIDAVGGITNLQLAPQGIVQFIYPMKNQEKAIGHNILLDDERRAEANLAIVSNRLTLAGPFALIQGGIAIIGRQPIFFTKLDPNSKVKKAASFWGFASALITLEDLIANTTLTTLAEHGYYYQLWRNHPDTGKKQIFATNAQTILAENLHATIKLPNAIWHLNISEVNPLDYNRHLFFVAILLTIIAISIGLYAYRLMLAYFLTKSKAPVKTATIAR